MKKFCVSLALAAISLIGYAQVVNVASVKKVTLPQGTAVDKAVVSPAGNYVVVSDLNVRGLKKNRPYNGQINSSFKNRVKLRCAHLSRR